VAEGGSSAEQDRGPAVLPERRLHHHRYPHRPQVRLLRGGKNPISSDLNPCLVLIDTLFRNVMTKNMVLRKIQVRIRSWESFL
jgi:hypothetical protein